MQKNNEKGHFKKIFSYMWEVKHWGLATLFFILLKEAAILVEPYIFREIISTLEEFFAESITQEVAMQTIMWLFVSFIIVYGITIGSNALMVYCLNRFETRVMYNAAKQFIEKVLNLSFRFHSNRKTGKLSKEYSRGISAIENFTDAFVFNFIPLVLKLVVISLVFAFVDWRLSVLTIIWILGFCVFTYHASNRLLKRRAVTNKSDDESTHRAMDALMNAETVKYFQKEPFETGRYQKLRRQWKTDKQFEWDGWIWVMSGQIGINVLAIMLLIGVVVYGLLQQQLIIADFVLVISYIGMTIGMLWNFQYNLRVIREAFTDLSAFFSYEDMQNEIVDEHSAAELNITEGNIAFADIQFRYQEEGKEVLRGITTAVDGGTSVALVGPSGVGKSTLVKLLYRFYDPQKGSITIDGQEITQVTQESLRRALAIVPQDTGLFNDTIAYNIAYGKEDATPEEIEAAARKAHIHDFIEKLPYGYETYVGERGVKLSGGEKQRIAIARAFLRDAPILVLDEATSSLDSASESEIQGALQELMKGRTTIIIAHRLATVMNADKIIVLKDGIIEQEGTHTELLEHGGLYNRLWELQAGGYLE